MMDRQIMDGIIMVHEIIHSTYHRKEAWMIIKIEISKAYNQVAWDYLLERLKAFGFGEV